MVPLSEGGPVNRIVFNAVVDTMYGREVESAEEIETVCEWQDRSGVLILDALEKAGSGYWNKEEDQKRLYGVVKGHLASVLQTYLCPMCGSRELVIVIPDRVTVRCKGCNWSGVYDNETEMRECLKS